MGRASTSRASEAIVRSIRSFQRHLGDIEGSQAKRHDVQVTSEDKQGSC